MARVAEAALEVVTPWREPAFYDPVDFSSSYVFARRQPEWRPTCLPNDSLLQDAFEGA